LDKDTLTSRCCFIKIYVSFSYLDQTSARYAWPLYRFRYSNFAKTTNNLYEFNSYKKVVHTPNWLLSNEIHVQLLNNSERNGVERNRCYTLGNISRFLITSRFHCLAAGYEVNSISDIQILNVEKKMESSTICTNYQI